MGQELSIVGKRLPRPDGGERATGAAKYTVDIKLPGMLVGKVLRSPYPHARILKIDKSRAEKLPGVDAVIIFEDIPKKPFNIANKIISRMYQIRISCIVVKPESYRAILLYRRSQRNWCK